MMVTQHSEPSPCKMVGHLLSQNYVDAGGVGRCHQCDEINRLLKQREAAAIEQCAIEAGERSPEGVSSHTMLGDMWDSRIQKLRADVRADSAAEKGEK